MPLFQASWTGLVCVEACGVLNSGRPLIQPEKLLSGKVVFPLKRAVSSPELSRIDEESAGPAAFGVFKAIFASCVWSVVAGFTKGKVWVDSVEKASSAGPSLHTVF